MNSDHSMNPDHSKICRLCLGEAEVMCPIFNTYSKSNPQTLALPQRIMTFAQIKLEENDGLPSSICYQCLAQVDKSYQFKLLCEQSDVTLRQNLQDPGDSESEAADWEMMKFTPEVIINEGEDNSNEPQENGQQGESDSDQSGKNSSYPLSEVQELLRHHGTEIRLQAVNGNKPTAASSPGGQNGNYESAVENGNGVDQHMGLDMDYYPLYGVAAMLNNHTNTNTNTAYSNGSMSVSMPNLLPRLPISTSSLSSLLHRKGELRPELSFLSPQQQRSRRSRDGQKLFQCRLCPKSYSFSSALSRHKAVHNTELRPHICNICKKGFADPEKLERHMRTHVSDQLFSCDICGRVFKALATFERHKLMTQGKCRQFSCGLCGLGFQNKTKLKLHPCKAAPHDRLYPCPQCSEVFNSRDAFESHVVTHSGMADRSLNTQAISLITTGDDRRSI